MRQRQSYITRRSAVAAQNAAAWAWQELQVALDEGDARHLQSVIDLQSDASEGEQ